MFQNKLKCEERLSPGMRGRAQRVYESLRMIGPLVAAKETGVHPHESEAGAFSTTSQVAKLLADPEGGAAVQVPRLWLSTFALSLMYPLPRHF